MNSLNEKIYTSSFRFETIGFRIPPLIRLFYSTPQYSMASDVALNLWNVEYKDDSDVDENGVQFKAVRWQYDELNLRRLIIVLQAQWTTSSVQYVFDVFHMFVMI